MVSVYPNVKAGKLRALAVTTKSRVPTAPEVPTLDESGVPGFDIAASDGVYAPAGTPKAIVDKLNAAFRQALEDPQVRDSLVSRGAFPVPGTPADLAHHIAVEYPMWVKLVKDSGARSMNDGDCRLSALLHREPPYPSARLDEGACGGCKEELLPAAPVAVAGDDVRASPRVTTCRSSWILFGRLVRSVQDDGACVRAAERASARGTVGEGRRRGVARRHRAIRRPRHPDDDPV